MKYIRDLNLDTTEGSTVIIPSGKNINPLLYFLIFDLHFSPSNIDFLLWESAINDYEYRTPFNGIIQRIPILYSLKAFIKCKR